MFFFILEGVCSKKGETPAPVSHNPIRSPLVWPGSAASECKPALAFPWWCPAWTPSSDDSWHQAPSTPTARQCWPLKTLHSKRSHNLHVLSYGLVSQISCDIGSRWMAYPKLLLEVSKNLTLRCHLTLWRAGGLPSWEEFFPILSDRQNPNQKLTGLKMTINRHDFTDHFSTSLKCSLLTVSDATHSELVVEVRHEGPGLALILQIQPTDRSAVKLLMKICLSA